ncbi:Glycine-rich protein domain [Nannocystis exedens]|uniref:Glycine-rich protein domain n=1 Tax=Nannocystis exedens TaxID=54 RepID=A0A1I2FWA7_9BACT|nr:Epstein-Barr nuclear antigen 1/EBV nuclear antigen 1 [Nannocystis exedens]SFF08806.1 Glycine-rich protein domain [Nannocystis exedens]
MEPNNDGEPTRGGTLTFTNIGAPGYWGRRIEAEPGDPRCDVQSETIDFGWGSEFCCRTRHEVTSDRLTPFNEQLHLVLEGPLRVKALAVYQPLGASDGPWGIRSFWDRRTPDQPYNLHFSGPDDAQEFLGDLGNNCAYYAMQEQPFPCGPGSDPYCPGSDLDYYGWAGSKLVVMLASMPYADDPALLPLSCIADGEDERAQDAPWVGVSPSELNRDGWSGYHPCHCFNNTNNGQLGDGCGQINVFEVIAEASGPQWGNRDIISTGIRSYQVGSLGGVTCGIQSCGIEQFPADADLVDVNSLTAMNQGAVIDAEDPAMSAGPAWRRALDDRFYVFLLDEPSRTVQVAVIHPGDVAAAAQPIVPALPDVISREVVDGFLKLRLPQ